jgi:3-deoxy-D-manno-octulosonic-acid transferase
MKIFIDILYLLGLIVVSPKVIYRMITQGRYRTGLGQRLGVVSRLRTDKKCIWIHAVSVGEVNATRTLVASLTEELKNYEIVISTTTDTGYTRAKSIYGNDHSVFYFPFDFSWAMKRAFTTLRPDVCLLMELEVWPNFAQTANQRNIPIIIVNGRLSDKSFPRYRKVKAIAKWMFEKVSLVLAQTEEYAERFRTLGCDDEKVIVTNSLKYDTAQTGESVAGAEELARQIALDDEQLWIAGGTGPGEEQMVLDVFTRLKTQPQFNELRLAIIPRKPERFDDVAELIEQTGFSFTRYSLLKDTAKVATEKPEIILGDTMGDLRKFYSIATNTVFVGRTLVPMGGSDMMEPAALGKCTIFGKHTFNFKQTVKVLLEGEGAIEVKDPDQLLREVQKCLEHPEHAQRVAKNGQQVIKQNQGATKASTEAIIKLLGE